MVNKFYQDEFDLGEGNKKFDISIYGAEFITMISAIIGYRIKNLLEENDKTLNQALKIFSSYKIYTIFFG